MWRNSSCLSLRERWQRRKALTERARPLAGMASWPSQSASLGRSPSGTGVPPPPPAGGVFPKGRAKNVAEEPLPPTSGEVASRRDDGEGKPADGKTSPLSLLRRQLSQRESQERSGTALASHFGGGGTAQAVTERARPLADPLASPARKKTKTDTFCRHKRKFRRNEKDVAKSLQKYCKIYYENHQSLRSTLVQGAKK